MKLPDADVAAARVFAFDQFEDRRIIKPGLHIVADAIRPDERHHFKLRPLRLGEFVRPLVRTAVGDDADDAVAAEDLAHLIERVEGRGLLVVVQMRVEDFYPLLCTNSEESHRCDSDCARKNCTNCHVAPLGSARTLTHR